MTIIKAYLDENRKYIDDDSSAAISSLADSMWPAILAGLQIVNGGADYPGIDCSVCVTHETLADFDASRVHYWSEKGVRIEHECGQYKAVEYRQCQLHRGETRLTQLVIDLGDIRAVLS